MSFKIFPTKSENLEVVLTSYKFQIKKKLGFLYNMKIIIKIVKIIKIKKKKKMGNNNIVLQYFIRKKK